MPPPTRALKSEVRRPDIRGPARMPAVQLSRSDDQGRLLVVRGTSCHLRRSAVDYPDL